MAANSRVDASIVSRALLASRGFKKPPAKLGRIIELVDLVPPDEPLLSLADWQKDQEFRRWVVESNRASLKRWLRQKLRGLPPKFIKHVIQDDGRWHAFWFFGALHRYDFVREARRKLRAIASAVREAEATERLPVYLYLETHNNVFIDESWMLRKTASDEFERALFDNEETVNARYIRECGVCRRIFYAGREKQPGCNANHSDILRQRKSRKKNPKPPARLDAVKEGLKRLCKAKGWEQFPQKRTPATIKELSEYCDATIRQCERSLDYIDAIEKKRADTNA